VTACIPPLCAGSSSVTVSSGKTTIDSDYRSVTEQTGIKAGDGGFNVNVQGVTALTGGVITSTDKAAQDSKNSFASAGGVTLTDIQNTADYNASGASVTLGYSSAPHDKDGNPITDAAGNAIPGKVIEAGGIGSDKGNAGSITQAAISGVAGNTSTRTGDSETGIKPIFDAGKVQDNLNAQVSISQAALPAATQGWAAYASEQAAKAMTPEEKACWAEGGACRVAGHVAIGALAGGTAGAAGAGVSQAVIPTIGEVIKGTDLSDAAKQLVIAGLGAAIGGAVGGTAGVVTGSSATVNNYLTATDLRSRDQRIAGCQAAKDVECEVKALREFDLKSAVNSAGINHGSVLTEAALQSEKAQLEKLLADTTVSDAAKALAGSSIRELDVAINAIQKSPVLRDAAELGLIVADVVTLGTLAAGRALTSTAIKALIETRTGREVSIDAATVIANNFYRDGAVSPQALATSSGLVIQATSGKTTTVLGSYIQDMKGIIVEQTGAPKSMDFMGTRPGGFNVLNVPDSYANALHSQGADVFWNQVNKPFLDAAIQRGDEIYLASRPTEALLNRTNSAGVLERSGFGREYDYLRSQGYTYDSATGAMKKGASK
ncbi:MAG: hypothetical protein Q7U62_11155, partial [Burkholderiaceae bacterium]|nr:hypothetical protein [Burkholderiaceae bacterium]